MNTTSTYWTKSADLELDIEIAKRAHYANPNKLTIKNIASANRALELHHEMAKVQSELAYMANHINQLDESDFESPFEYSSSIDQDVVNLCEEYGV